MAEGSKIFTDLFDNFDTFIDDYFGGYVEGLIEQVGIMDDVLLTIYVFFMAIRSLKGLSMSNTTEMIKNMILVIFAVKLATNLAFYNTWVIESFNNIPKFVLYVIPVEVEGSDISTLAGLLDEIVNQTVEQIKIAYESLRAWNIGPALAIVIYYLFVVIFLVSTAFSVLIAKMGIAILVLIGPLVIIMIMFESTRHFTVQWLMYAVNVFLVILFSTVILLAISSLNLNENLDFKDLVSMLRPVLVLGVGFALMKQVPSMASSLSGGIGLSSSLSDKLTSALSSGTNKVAGASKDILTRNFDEKRKAKKQQRIVKHGSNIRTQTKFREQLKSEGANSAIAKIKASTTSATKQRKYLKGVRNAKTK